MISDYIMFGSCELRGYMCIRSFNGDIFIRIGSDGCEMEKLHSGYKLNVIGVDSE